MRTTKFMSVLSSVSICLEQGTPVPVNAEPPPLSSNNQNYHVTLFFDINMTVTTDLVEDFDCCISPSTAQVTCSVDPS